MWALITGASSGIGRDMARYLHENYKYNHIIYKGERDEKKYIKVFKKK